MEVDDYYVCLGHGSENLHGMGKLDAKGYHGSPEHDHMFYI
jgi:hypothetical protein